MATLDPATAIVFIDLQNLVDTISKMFEEEYKQHLKTQEMLQSLQETIKVKNDEIFRLTEKLNNNMTNSNMPSSSNPFVKPKPSAINKAKGQRGKQAKKRNSGQVGQECHTIKLKEKPDTIENLMPTARNGCSNYGKCLSGANACSTRNQVELEIKTVQI